MLSFVNSSSTSTRLICSFHGQCWRREGRDVSPISTSLFRRNKKKKTLKSTSDPKLVVVVLDLDDVAHRASTSLRRFFRSSEAKFHEFLSSGAETISDLQTLVTFDQRGRIVVACRRSSLEFLVNFFVWSFVAAFAVRFLVRLGLSSGFGFGARDVVRRRDRSLAGREVVVGRRLEEKKGFFKARVSPLSDVRGRERRHTEAVLDKRATRQEVLPAWWPDSLPSPVPTMETKDSQREANRLIRAIMDNRMSGKDLTEDDMIQLRRICKTSGAKISFDTANARDSFYRASVDFVLNTCSNVTCQPTHVQIDGEEARQFVAGFADNIGLDSVRAARLVCAAVAARTRSRFLQAWASEIQGKRSEVLDELSKICHIHRIFPPEEYSPEMEMVARGLEKHLKLEQREHLLKLLEQACGAESQRIAVEALGLMQHIPRNVNGESVFPGHS